MFCFILFYFVCFCYFCKYWLGKSANQQMNDQISNLPTSTERQAHTRSLGAGKSTGIVCSDLCRPRRVGQVSLVVHSVTVRNVVLSARAYTLRGEGSTGRHVSVKNGEFCRSRKVEVQRHFII